MVEHDVSAGVSTQELNVHFSSSCPAANSWIVGHT
jgi:hypothetical protein